MDNKRLVIGMVLAMAVVFGWQMFLAHMYEKHPEWKPKPAEPAAQSVAAPQADPSTAPAALQPDAPEGVESPATRSVVAARTSAATQPARVVLGGGDPKGEQFPIQLDLVSTGAGIDLATLKRFKARLAKDVYTFQAPPTSDPHTRPMATQSVVVNGTRFDLAALNWNLEPGATERSATFLIDLAPQGTPLVRVRKSYEITQADHPGAGYEVQHRQTFQNIGDQPVRISTAFTGPAVPPQELDRGPDRQIVEGYLDGTRLVAAKQSFLDQFNDSTPHGILTNKDGQPLLWAGGASVYFNAILRPESRDPASVVPKHLTKVEAYCLNPEAPAPLRNVILQFATGEFDVAPGTTLELPMSMYLGPKHRRILNRDYYEAFPRMYDATLVIKNDWCGICTFQWLVSALVTMLAWFHFVLRDWGLAIIALVCIVRIALHPITKRSQISMMKMGKMGPEIERLKKKYGDDKDELNKAMMQVYKEQGFTPILGCLPMFLQMPIWIALYAALNSTFELRQAPFLWGWTWIDDLARPDRLIEWSPIRLFFGIEIRAFNILPILLAVVFYLQQEFTPKPPATTPEQVQQQKMMKWMTLIFPVFLYNGPSGLNLYILTSTTIGIIESKRIRDHIKQREEAEKAGKVIVDARPTRQSRKKDGKDKEEPKKKTGLGGWLADLQEKAEQIRREAEKKRG